MTRRRVLIYLSGKYSGNVPENIENAKRVARKLWDIGYTVICPHTNTEYFENDCCKCKYEDLIEGDLVILRRVDVVFMLEGWQESRGAVEEHNEAAFQGIPIFYTIEQLEDWFNSKTR